MAHKTRLRELRDASGKSQQAVADAVGISDTSYQYYEYGKRDIPGDILQKIAALYDVTVDYLLGITAEKSRQTIPDDGRLAPTPFFGAVAGGMPTEMIEDRSIKEAPARFLEDDPDCFLVRIKGNSENRRGLFDGDYALISPKYKEPTPGDLFLVAVNGDEATIKEVAVLENGVELIPDSYDPTYVRQIYNFNEADTPSITIMGKYVWHCAAF